MKQNLHNFLRKYLLSALFCFVALGCAAADFEVDGIAYRTITKNEVAVISKTEKYSGAVSIPDTVIYHGATYIVEEIGQMAFYDCKSLTSIVFPNTLTKIGEYAFTRCSGLTFTTLPEGLTSIGNAAFDACSELSSVVLPESLTEIGHSVFAGCLSLLSVTLPKNLKTIPDYLFINCSRLSFITIPERLESIGEYAFANCVELPSITIPESVKDIGKSAFYGCDTFTSITIPEGITSIKNELFRSCDRLISMTIPKSVTSIGYRAFSSCFALTSITIPENVTSIGYEAFTDCKALTSVKVSSSVPASASEDTFHSYIIPLYVPIGSREAYAEHAVWGKFNNIVEYDLSALPGVSASGESGIVLTSPAPGSLMIHCAKECSAILQRVDGTTLMPLTLSEGENRVDGLAPGLYLVGGQKVVVQ